MVRRRRGFAALNAKPQDEVSALSLWCWLCLSPRQQTPVCTSIHPSLRNRWSLFTCARSLSCCCCGPCLAAQAEEQQPAERIEAVESRLVRHTRSLSRDKVSRHHPPSTTTCSSGSCDAVIGSNTCRSSAAAHDTQHMSANSLLCCVACTCARVFAAHRFHRLPPFVHNNRSSSTSRRCSMSCRAST